MNIKIENEDAERITDLLHDLICELVDNPDDVNVIRTISNGGNTIVLTIRTANNEVGQVIGRSGRNAQALRTIFEAIAAKYKIRIVLEISDGRSYD